MTMRKHHLAKCEECPYQTGTSYVPSQFPTRPIKLAVIGEAPGPQEARLGIPFTGPSGDLLNQVLAHHGVDRTEVLITNVCSCRPSGPTEVPPKAAIAACSERLKAEIEASGAQTIIAVGGTAATTLVDDGRKITKLRVGPPKPYKYDNNINVIPTWHPAYCLRNPDAFPSFVADIGKIKGNNSGSWIEPEWRVFDDPVVAVEAFRRLEARTDRGVIDIEVGTEKDFDYTHPEEFSLLCVGISYAKKKAVVFGENALRDGQVRAALRRYLSSIKIIAHNGKFDLRGLSPLVGVQKLWFDTMLGSYCMDERPGQHSLEVLSIEKLGSPDWKNEIKKYIPRGGSYADVPRNVLYHYNALDVSNTWDLCEYFEENLSPQQRGVHDFLITASNELIHLELNGITFDEAYNKELHDSYLERIVAIEKQIDELIGRPINPRSPKQVTNYFHENKIRVTTTNADFLAEIRPKLDGEVGTFIDLLLKHRRESKLYGTYVKGLAGKSTYGKVYTSYLLHGTTSGRLASRNPNMQNIVRNKPIRNQFTVEDENNVLIQCFVPGTKILKRDLTWSSIENLHVDDELIAFNKHVISNMEPAKVTGITKAIKDCYEVFTDQGSIVCSWDHLWPVSGLKPRPTHRVWKKTIDLIGKDVNLTWVAEPWETDTSFEGGYLSGIIDGEATLNLCVNKDTRISIAQKPGPVLDQTVSFLKEKGFDCSVYPHSTVGVSNIYVNGGKKSALKIIGMFRPQRFLKVSDKIWMGERKHTKVKIREIRHVGMREVIAVQTSTQTLIANGFYSHNCDYKQAEGRTITTLAKDEYLKSIFSDSSRDIFSELATQIFGENWGKEERVKIKSVFYGLSYGREAPSIAKELDIPLAESVELLRNFKALIPATVQWQASITEKVMKGEDLITPFGRKRSFYLITNENRTDVINEALSFMPQSIASDICLSALIALRPMLEGLAKIRLTIHDALVFECHHSKAEQVIEIAQREMVGAGRRFTDYVPFAVDVSTGKRLGEL